MIRLRLLGSVDLVGRDGASLDAALRRSKGVAVLAYLAAAQPRGFHRRDKIAALFWPELPADRARAALRVTLTRLRDQLGAEVIVSRGAAEIGLDTVHVWCDAAAIDDALRAGDAPAASALYGGDFLDGFHAEGTAAEFEQWVDAQRSRIRGALVQALVARGDADSARRAVSLAPTDEIANRRLISLLRTAGEQAEALRAFDEFSRRIARDLDVEPSAETAALVADLRRARSPSPVRTVAAEPRAIATEGSIMSSPAPPRRSRFAAGLTVAALGLGVVAAFYTRTTDAAPPAPAPHWVTRAHNGGRVPQSRMGASAVLDSTNDALIVFGGQVFGEDAKSSVNMNDVWRYRGLHSGEIGAWTRLEVSGDAPAPRWLYAAAYDRTHDRLVVHGGARGFTSPCANDTWILEHASGIGSAPKWTQVRTDGPTPAPHAGNSAALDAAHRRLIVFGGHDCLNTFNRDVWILSFGDTSFATGTWRRVRADTGAGVPFGRSAFASLYDEVNDRLFVHGGYAGARSLSDLWALDGVTGERASWRPLRCDGRTPALSSHAGAYDAASDTWLITGGADSTNVERRDTWRLTNLRRDLARCRWELIAVGDPLPNARLGHSAVWDPVEHALVIEGGQYQGVAFHDVLTLQPRF